ncbi:MAG: nucleotidyltransferase family protein [Vampirovibrionales bacterium]
MLKLKETWKAELHEILRHHAPEFEVWAYGSRVTGHAHDASDLDLVLIHPKRSDIPCATLAELKQALQESHLPISVDIMDWTRLPTEFHQQINAHRVLLFPASNP